MRHGVVKERDAEYKCGGGDPLNHFDEDAGGSCAEFPWGSTCQAPQLKVPNWNVDGASRIDGEADMMALIALGNSLYVSFDVYDSFWDLQKGSIYRGPAEGHSCGGHAVTLVGYGADSGVKYWTIQNSWGADWQVKGFGRFERGINLAGIEEGAYSLKAWVTGGREVICSDTDNGAVDPWGDGCAAYASNPSWCVPGNDGDGFVNAEMCCACGGGAYSVIGEAPPAPPPTPAPTTTTAP